MSNILSFSNWASADVLNENVQRAKKYLIDQYVEENGLSEVTPEDEVKALDIPIYKQIRELLKDNDGYVYAFVKFAIDHNAPFTAPNNGMSLTKLYSLIREYAGSLNTLPMSIEEYAMSTEPINGVDSFEALMDAFSKIELRKKHRWVIDKVNGTLRRSIKTMSPAEIDRLYKAAEIIDRVDSTIGEFEDPETGKKTNNQRLILIKSNAYSDGQVYLKALEDTAQGIFNSNIIDKIEEVKKVSPEASVIYADGRYLAIAVRTERAQRELFKIVHIAWCINDRGLWNNYGGKPDALQYNIFDFDKNINDKLYLVGNTVGFDGVLRNCHDRNDDPILKTSNWGNNLKQLGYPDELIESLTGSVVSEASIKPLVTGLGLNSSDLSTLLLTVIKASYSRDVESDPEIKKILSNIIKNQILNKLADDKIIEIYSKNGIFTPFSARVLNTLVPNISDSEKNQILEKNNMSINSLKKIVDHLGPEYNIQATSIVNNAEEIKEIIISGDKITE